MATQSPLPQFDGDACSLGWLALSECGACARSCPTSALVSGEDGLMLDAAICTGCGACAAACPQRAVAIEGVSPLPPIAPDRAGRMLLVCPARVPGGVCLQALGLEALAALWLSGLRSLHLDTGDCASCPSGRALPFTQTLQTLNAILSDRALPPLHTAPVTGTRLPRLSDGRDRVDPSRRALFGSLARGLAPETRPALAHLQAYPGPAPRHAHSPRIDPALCTGCNACLRICPASAMTLINTADGNPAYHMASSDCSGCSQCTEVCESDAITIDTLAPAAPDLALRRFQCRACGTPGHLPADHLRADGLCPICARTRHHAKLHQVIA
ncbi:4Fe-4S dicluster domain-containing protein [Paracoccus endophyticus]|uniref:4Fe-4S dicluster domain-containing protein n=1 Tax=Paracoccus endophyticus TaxID=2233774 RepID=UPI000DD6CDD6